jgi:hypothetical protein
MWRSPPGFSAHIVRTKLGIIAGGERGEYNIFYLRISCCADTGPCWHRAVRKRASRDETAPAESTTACARAGPVGLKWR